MDMPVLTRLMIGAKRKLQSLKATCQLSAYEMATKDCWIYSMKLNCRYIPGFDMHGETFKMVPDLLNDNVMMSQRIFCNPSYNMTLGES